MYRLGPGEFMADWFSADGKRHRKRFPTSTAAQRHEHEQNAMAHAERCAAELNLAVHHTYRHKTARADLAKRAAAVITTVPA